MKTLEQWMDSFINQECSRQELLKQMGLYTYRWAWVIPQLGKEKAGDFYLLIQKNFDRILDKYSPEQGKFLPFFRTCLNKQRLQFLEQESWGNRRKNMYYAYFPEKVSCTAEYYQPYRCCDSFTSWLKKSELMLNQLPKKQQRITRKRILCLFLHYAFLVPDNLVGDLASIAGISSSDLEKYLFQVRGDSEKRIERWRKLKLSLNRMFSSLKTYEQYILNSENPYQKQEAQRKISYFRLRVENGREKLRKLSLTVTQKTIARVLDLPVGTVNSAVYYARKFLQPLPEEW